ncbi:hypothetical protein Trydic_g9855 [Trypoxylus dichotomus]
MAVFIQTALTTNSYTFHHDWQKVNTITKNTAESLKKHLVHKQTAKFRRIDNNTKQYKLDPTRTVVNLTDKTLPPDAISILERGGNFAVIPRKPQLDA